MLITIVPVSISNFKLFFMFISTHFYIVFILISDSTSKENDSPLTGNENGFSCPTCGKIFKKVRKLNKK